MIDLKEKTAEFNYQTPVHLRFSDMDMFGHANNAVYLTYFEQARSGYWKDILEWDWQSYGIVLVRSEIEYIKPITLEDDIWIYIRTSKIGNSSFETDYLVVAKKDDQEEIRTLGKTKQVTIDFSTKKPVAIPQEYKDKMMTRDKPQV